jgi:hypothetical protein
VEFFVGIFIIHSAYCVVPLTCPYRSLHSKLPFHLMCLITTVVPEIHTCLVFS